MVKQTLIIVMLLVMCAAAAGFYLFNSSEHSRLGLDSRGYVTKDVYNHYGSSNSKIAIITGMHPREDLSKTVVPYALKFYALTHNVEIVNYHITVTDSPQVFTTGRRNGEGLVARYVVSDIEESDYNMVIICHDHEKGYGNGYYIATPSMDTESVNLAEDVHKLIPSFNYYQRATDEKPKSSSITKVDNPIVATGTPVFVYEIPEWHGSFEAFSNSNRLIESIFNVL